MKTFKCLRFCSHPLNEQELRDFGTQAMMHFKNGYGVSVLCGKSFYSNGRDTYEVAILNADNSLCYTSGITDDVLGHRTADEVTDIMRQVQKLVV